MTERIEVWKPVVGFEGSYEVSSFGRVRSLDRQIWLVASHRTSAHWHPCKGRLLRPGKMNAQGHVSVALGRGNSQCVHALVAAAFIGPRPPGLDVCHRNGQGDSNAEDNLYYGTRSQNNRDVTTHDRRKLTVAQVHEVRRRNAAGETTASLARAFGVCKSNMGYVVSGRYYAHV